MSGGGGGVIIIHHLIQSGEFTPDECKTMQVIADRAPVCVNYKDSVKVATIVRKNLRRTTPIG